DGGDWFKISLLNANLPLNIIFNKGTGGTGNQTAELVLNSLTDVYFYNGTWYPSKQAAEAAIVAPAETKTVTVYFYNSDNWSEVHAWGWSTAGDIYTTWPGPQATAVNGKAGWFQVDAEIPVTI